MNTSKRVRRIAGWAAAIALVAVVGLVAVAATVYRNSAQGADSSDVWTTVSWRARLFALKARGGVPEFSWYELWQMTRHQGGFGLAAIIRDGVSIDGSVRNPFNSDNDHRVGGQIFHDHCATCHGQEGTGWHAPPLNHSGFDIGDSDLAIYKAVRDGIPNSPMIVPTLTVTERWQVVGYVRMLQLSDPKHAGNDKPAVTLQVTNDQILAAGSKSDEWLTYSGSLDGRRYSPLTEITPANVSQLRVRWVRQFDPGEGNASAATPLVVGGMMFTTDPPSNVVALDVKSGSVLWRYKRNVPDVPVCCGRSNRGLAVLGNVLYLGTLDGYLVALNAGTGAVIWQKQLVNWSDGYSITGAPLIVNGLVVVGISGGEFGIRGFLAAYDPETGQQRWRFDTIPDPGMPGHETWKNDAWKTGGGPTWVTGTFDPSLDLIYWGVGNPSPDFQGDVRPGDNLYTDSVIALHASTGKLAWHFQFTPHDEHDWDSNQTPILTDVMVKGTRRKVICWANRNGFYYVLDRVTGEFLAGASFIDQNWAKGLDAAGRPILIETEEFSTTGRLVRPGVAGATNWMNPAYDQQRGLVFVHASEGASVFTKAPNIRRGEKGLYLASAGSMLGVLVPVVRALDVATGAQKWEHYSPPLKEAAARFSGLLATGSGLVFGASGWSVFALDSSTGRELWSVPLGGDTRAAPITFTVDGKQVIAVWAGRAMFLFGL
jgi:alcohol dehydrogenase (cytochrome c)